MTFAREQPTDSSRDRLTILAFEALGENIPQSGNYLLLGQGLGSSTPFCVLAAPILSSQIVAIQLYLDASLISRVNSRSLLEQASVPLLQQIDDMLARSVILEMQIARERGLLTATTAPDRFQEYLGAISRPEGRRKFFAKYPILCRQIYIAARDWHDSIVETVSRAIQDGQDIHSCGPDALSDLTSIAIGMGDRQNSGRSVTRLEFRCGCRIFYKSRSGTLDIAYDKMLEWLRRSPGPCWLEHPSTVDKGHYCWQQVVEYEAIVAEDAPTRYYRYGTMVAIIYVLGGSDLHFENIICRGASPMIIDVESLCQPALRFADSRLTPAENELVRAKADSVLQSGLLPALSSLVDDDGPGTDVSALGGDGDQLTPYLLPMRIDSGTDRMRIELAQVEMNPQKNNPAPASAVSNLVRNVDHLVHGFQVAYRLLMSSAEWLGSSVDSPLRNFVSAHSRIVPRNTAFYSIIHMSSFHPSTLLSSNHRQTHYRALQTSTENLPKLREFVLSESNALWRNDIPVFYARTDAYEISGEGNSVRGAISESGFTRMTRRLHALSELDLSDQSETIRLTVALADLNSGGPIIYPSYVVSDHPAVGSHDMLDEAYDIGLSLSQSAIIADSEAVWLGTLSSAGADWRLGNLGPDLYHGLSGIAVFLAALAHRTEDQQFSNLAHAPLRTARRQVDRGMIDASLGLSGLPGFMLGSAICEDFLGCPGRYSNALDLPRVSRAVRESSEAEVSGGLAGTILCLLGNRRFGDLGNRAAVDKIIRLAADRIVESQQEGGGWVSPHLHDQGIAVDPLAGLAHGAAGIAWALSAAAARLTDTSLTGAAARGLKFERTLFDSVSGNWRDKRDARVLGDGPDADTSIIAWCHGAAGIALSRSFCSITDGEVDGGADLRLAVESTIRAGVGVNHSICHGDLGNIVILLTVASRSGNTEWMKRARVLADHAVDAGVEHGWLCGMPRGVRTPGLMTGLAGIGYCLLRLADHDNLPSIAAMGHG